MPLKDDASLKRAIDVVDGALAGVARLFLIIANACLALMLLGTAATILLRPFDLSYYWIWPWTMQFFVWMSFLGFYVVYRRGKDIAVDFVVLRLGDGAMVATRYFVAGMTMAVVGTIIWQMPVILESQVGVIDGVVTPWGEIERYSLSIPLGVSCVLIFLNAALDVLKAIAGLPELLPTHRTDPDS